MTPAQEVTFFALFLIGQTLFLILASALYRQFWPAPFWRFIERAYAAIAWPIIIAVEATVDAFWDLYYRTPKGKREHEAAKALRAAVFHRELHPHCRCTRTDRP